MKLNLDSRQLDKSFLVHDAYGIAYTYLFYSEYSQV